MELFGMTLNIAREFPPFVDAFTKRKELTNDFFRQMFERYKTVLGYFGDTPLSLPANLRFEVSDSATEYSIRCEPRGRNLPKWTMILPMKLIEAEERMRSLNSGFTAQSVEGCQPPCAGYREK